MHTAQIPQESALEFITAGKAIFTLRSIESGNRFTYKVMTPPDVSKENAHVLWLMVLTGCNNESDYTYAGCLRKNNDQWEYRAGKTKIKPTAPSLVAFTFVFGRLLKGAVMNKLEIWHEGKCCRCGRKLTTPESVANGIGPECASIKSKY